MKRGIIPGAIFAHPLDAQGALASHPKDVDVVVYCACPNEEAAATCRQTFEASRLSQDQAASRRHPSLEAKRGRPVTTVASPLAIRRSPKPIGASCRRKTLSRTLPITPLAGTKPNSSARLSIELSRLSPTTK